MSWFPHGQNRNRNHSTHLTGHLWGWNETLHVEGASRLNPHCLLLIIPSAQLPSSCEWNSWGCWQISCSGCIFCPPRPTAPILLGLVPFLPSPCDLNRLVKKDKRVQLYLRPSSYSSSVLQPRPPFNSQNVSDSPTLHKDPLPGMIFFSLLFIPFCSTPFLRLSSKTALANLGGCTPCVSASIIKNVICSNNMRCNELCFTCVLC